jgi:hypothetical protein
VREDAAVTGRFGNILSTDDTAGVQKASMPRQNGGTDFGAARRGINNRAIQMYLTAAAINLKRLAKRNERQLHSLSSLLPKARRVSNQMRDLASDLPAATKSACIGECWRVLTKNFVDECVSCECGGDVGAEQN